MTADSQARPVAVVTGASRGLGRGIAVALGEAGFVVYCTGRSAASATGPWPGTVGETAAAVDAAGGVGLAAVCDHLDDAQTEALFARVDAEHGRLDLLVNNAFAMPDWSVTDSPFWERPLSLWRDMIDVGLRSSYAASTFGARIMVRQRRGLIANTSGPGAKAFRHSLPYGVGKAGQDKLAHDMAHDLLPYGVAAISLWPGLIATERTLHNLSISNVGNKSGTVSHMESTSLIGRVLARLHDWPELMSLSGGTYYSTELAERLGIEDVGGGRPLSRRPIFGEPLFGPVARPDRT
ncbi:MAG: SDR family NAD(P)-dependent oxidoreductase [Rhizobiaceae bacterium]|nr:SDR family NAD(P)-dependent oxidoreductase [Rhizobiaceae bacterium]